MDPRSSGIYAPRQPLPSSSNSIPPSSKQTKKRRDPNAPKAVSNAYMIFCKSQRAELKAQNPDLPFGKIGAKLGEIWRQMTPDEKKPYEDRASVDRERYRKEMLEYQTSGNHDSEKKLKDDSGDDDLHSSQFASNTNGSHPSATSSSSTSPLNQSKHEAHSSNNPQHIHNGIHRGDDV